MARNTRNGVPVIVTIAGYTGLKYGFLSRVRDGLYPELGQTRIYSTIADITGIVFGCNSPKPPRASKLFATGYESSFCDKDKVSILKANGWQVKRGTRARIPRSTARSTVYYIAINGIKRAWNSANSASLPNDLLTATGIKKADANETGLVWGCEFPRPATAKTNLSDGSNFGTFVDPSKEDNIPSGWILDSSKANYTLQQLRDILPAPSA